MIWVWVLTQFLVHQLSFDLTHFLYEFTNTASLLVGEGWLPVLVLRPSWIWWYYVGVVTVQTVGAADGDYDNSRGCSGDDVADDVADVKHTESVLQ